MIQPMDYRARTRSVREAARRQLQKLREERLGQRVPKAPDPEVSAGAEAEAREEVHAEEILAESVSPEMAEPDTIVTPEPAREEPAPEEPAPEAAAPPPAEWTPEVQPKDAALPAAKRKAPARKAAVKPAPRPRAVKESAEDSSIRRAALAEMFEDEPAVPAAPAPKPARKAEAKPLAPPDVTDLPPVAEEPPEDSTAAMADPVPPALAEEEPVASQAEPSDALRGLPGAGPGLIWMLGQCGITSLEDLAACDPEKLSTDLGLVGQILDVSLWRDYALARVEGLSRAS